MAFSFILFSLRTQTIAARQKEKKSLKIVDEKCENRNIQTVASYAVVDSARTIFIHNYIHFVQMNDKFSHFLVFFSPPSPSSFFLFVVNIICNSQVVDTSGSNGNGNSSSACSKCSNNNKNYDQIDE